MFSVGRGRWSVAVTIILLLLAVPFLSGEELYIEKRDIADLKIPSISCMVQDHRGYLWMGTPGGLIRYDGHKTELINRKSHPLLPSDQVTAMEYVLDSDELWIGTVAGPVRLELRTGEMIPVTFHRSAGNYTSAEVTDIISVPDGQMFVVMGGAIYHSRDGNPLEIIPKDTPGDESGEILDISKGNDGKVWVLSTLGLKQWIPELQVFRHVRDFRGASCLSVFGNELWIGYSRGGVTRFNPEDNSVSEYSSHKETSSIVEGSDGRVWVGSRTNGITIIDPVSRRIEYSDVDREHPYRLPSGRVSFLYTGFSGHVWIGTTDSGLFSVDPAKKNHLTYTTRSGSGSLPAGLIQVIFEDSLGYIWAGSDIDGLSRIDPVTGELRSYERRESDFFSIGGDQINDMMEDSTGRIWIGTDHGPYLYLPEVDGFEPAGEMMNAWPDFVGQPVLALAEGSDGSIWISFRSGDLYRLDPRGRDHSNFRYSTGSAPVVLLSDRQGLIWAGSRTNLRLFNSDGDLIKTWISDGASGLPEGGVSSIFNDSRGRVWIGGPAGLAYNISIDASFLSAGSPVDLSQGVTGIAEDADGNIWVSDGIRVHFYNHEGSYLGAMNELVGLTPSGIIRTIVKDSSGTMLLGAGGEIWTFDRPVFTFEPEPPEVYLTEFRVLNDIRAEGHALDEGYSITLSPDDGIFSIGFGAVDFRYRGRIGFQYRLLEFHDDWVDSGRTDSVTYVKLPPGDYQFSVRAYNEQGGMSAESSLLTLKIDPVFWRTIPAIFIYISVLAVVIGLVVKLREGTILKGQIIELEEARKSILIANEKLSYQTRNDSLTGLLNRRGFDQGINLALDTAKRNKLTVTLFMMDVDFFKLFNDNYGHVQGDEVLRSLGKTLRSVFERSTDIIARYGGEEFAVVFIGDNTNASVTLANDLIIGIENLDIPHEFSTVSHRLTLSVGVATLKGEGDISVESLVDRADKALYEAKTGGRDRTCFTGMMPILPALMKNQFRPLVLDPDITE